MKSKIVEYGSYGLAGFFLLAAITFGISTVQGCAFFEGMGLIKKEETWVDKNKDNVKQPTEVTTTYAPGATTETVSGFLPAPWGAIVNTVVLAGAAVAGGVAKRKAVLATVREETTTILMDAANDLMKKIAEESQKVALADDNKYTMDDIKRIAKAMPEICKAAFKETIEYYKERIKNPEEFERIYRHLQENISKIEKNSL